MPVQPYEDHASIATAEPVDPPRNIVPIKMVFSRALASGRSA